MGRTNVKQNISRASDYLDFSFGADEAEANICRPNTVVSSVSTADKDQEPADWLSVVPSQKERQALYGQQAKKCQIQLEGNKKLCDKEAQQAFRERWANSESVPPLDLYQGWKASRLARGPNGDCGAEEVYDNCIEQRAS